MRVIVPLAGPDFVSPDGRVKAMLPLDGEPMLRRTLLQRSWAETVSQYSFVLHDNQHTRAFAAGPLSAWFPQATVTFLSTFTRGAAFSSLAGICLGQAVDDPLVIDLADIGYRSTLNPVKAFAEEINLGAIALTFTSENPLYSYLKLDSEGNFVEAAEKRLISDNASAGTYIFRDIATFLHATAHSAENEETQAFNGLFYICPLLNGVKDQGKSVALSPATQVRDIKMDLSADG